MFIRCLSSLGYIPLAPHRSFWRENLMNRRAFLAALSATSIGAMANAQNAPSPAASYRFIALGDMGTGDNAQYSLAAAMTTEHAKRPFDVALTLGDNIY